MLSLSSSVRLVPRGMYVRIWMWEFEACLCAGKDRHCCLNSAVACVVIIMLERQTARIASQLRRFSAMIPLGEYQ